MLRYAQIYPYLKCNDDGLPDKSLRHAAYDTTVKLAAEQKKVLGEDYPDYLNKTRPLEKKSHKKYRADIYRNFVNPFFSKVFDMYRTILQTDDYGVLFNKPNIYQDYTNRGMFSNESLTEWFFTQFIKKCTEDANAVMAPVIKVFAKSDLEYNQTTLKLFSSESVIQLSDEICVLRSDEKTLIEVNDKMLKIGRILYFFDKDSMVVCRQTKKTNNISKTETKYEWEIIGQKILFTENNDIVEIVPLPHYNDEIPAKRIGHVLGEMVDGEIQTYVTLLHDALPHLKNIQQRASDKEIEILRQLHSVEWYFTTRKNCNAPGCVEGFIDGWDPENPSKKKKRKCPNCDNQGYPINGMEMIIITPDDINGGGGVDDTKPFNMPTPPGGQIERNIETLRELRAEILLEWESAYESISMGFIKKVPVVESGTAKSYDRQEYYKKLADISVHERKFLKLGYRWPACIMFGIQRNVNSILPEVNTPLDPGSFNLATQQEVLEELGIGLEKGIDGFLIGGLLERYSEKAFGKNTAQTKRVKLKNNIDPYVSIQSKDKNKILMINLLGFIKIGGAESEEVKNLLQNVYLSLNLDLIITECIGDDNGFLDKDLNYQKTQIYTRLRNYLPKTISKDIYKTIRVEPLVDEVGS